MLQGLEWRASGFDMLDYSNKFVQSIRSAKDSLAPQLPLYLCLKE